MTSRITIQQLESYLWDAAVLLRGTIDAGDYKQFIMPLLFYKRLCDVFDEETQVALEESGGDTGYAAFPENHRFQIPPEAHWREIRKVSRDVGQALQVALRTIETANPDRLYGIFGDAQWTNKDRLSDATLRDLIEHFSSLELTVANLPEDELGNGYEYLIKKFADDSGHTAAEFYTNRTVVHLMTEMLQPQPGESIYDPTCGSGGMLLCSVAYLRHHGQEWRNVKLFGQERNLMTSSIARMNCFLHGIEDFRIERGDTLAEPKFVEGDKLRKFDVVLANPPYSIKQWDRSMFSQDPWGRNFLGTPPQGRADYAFWQHILASMSPKNGRCAILFPHGVLFRQEEAEMRKKLIEMDLIECVLGLGPNLFYNSSMQSCIVICRSSKKPTHKKKILFINAVDEVTRERTQSYLTVDHINKITQAYHSFKSEPGFCSVVNLDEIQKNHYSLNIPLYISSSKDQNSQIDHKNSVSEALVDWITSSQSLRESLTEILPNFTRQSDQLDFEISGNLFENFTDYSSWKRVRLGDVCDEISIRVDEPASSDYERFVGLEHLDSGELKVRRWGETKNLVSSMKAFSTGDILFARRNAYLKRASLATFDGLCSGDAIVLREKLDQIIPGFLVFILNTDKFWEFAIANAAGTMSRRVNVKTLLQFEIDLPPLDLQVRILEVLWAIHTVIEKQQTLLTALKNNRNAIIVEHFNDKENTIIIKQLGNVSDVIYGMTVNGARLTLPSEMPYLRVANVQREHIDLSEIKNIRCSETEILKYALMQGDVLIVEGHADVNEIGRAAIWTSSDKTILHQNHIIRVRCSLEILPEYLCIYVNSQHGCAYIRSHAKSSSGLHTINSTVVKNLPIPVPSLLNQKEFIHKIEEYDRIIKASNDLKESLQKVLAEFIKGVI
ncbi:N-6 DNA Methylase [anaerobic digester metagenome]